MDVLIKTEPPDDKEFKKIEFIAYIYLIPFSINMIYTY